MTLFLNKQLFFCGLIICLTINLKAQKYWPVDSIAVIERAYVVNGTLHNPYYIWVEKTDTAKREDGYVSRELYENCRTFNSYEICSNSLFLHSSNIRNSHFPIFTSFNYSSSSSFLIPEPYIWEIASDSTFNNLTESISRGWSFKLHSDLLERKDTFQRKADLLKKWEQYEKGEISYEKLQSSPYHLYIPYRNYRDIYVLSSYFNYYTVPFNLPLDVDYKIYDKKLEYWKTRSITYEIRKIEDINYLVFLRTENSLYSWGYYYPKLNEPDDLNPKQIHCYCATESQPEYFSKDSILAINPKLDSYLSGIKFDMLPNFSNANYNAISDTLFFDGHFKAYEENGNIFIINQKHGLIYYLDKTKIVRIGQIDVSNYKYKIDNVKVFVEDIDNNQLIIFAPITWISNNLPRPSIKIILDKSSLEETFGKASSIITRIKNK